MNLLLPIVAFVVFPGFVFTAVVGLLSTWIDRKVTARIHARVGPPWYQPFVDTVKLLGKETLVPEGAKRAGFLLAPLLGLAAVTLASTILWSGAVNMPWRTSFVGDLIVIIYLLIMPSLAIIMGGSASGNPFGAFGASREMKLVMAYELPFLLAIFTAVYKMGGMLKIDEIVAYQATNGAVMQNISCIIAFIVSLLCIQAKLAYVPFDMPEAEQEIIAGPFTEYSGAPLAAFKLTRAMMLFTLPVFLVTVFMGGFTWSGWSILWGILKYVGILVFIILVKNTNPRLRIDQAVRFFWLPWTILAVIGLALAILGY
jgi:NADH-quinone oxidoreductase subunit H